MESKPQQQPTPILEIAWTRFAQLDAISSRRTKKHLSMRRLIALLGVLATLFAILSQSLPMETAGLLGLIIRGLLITLPILASGIAAFTSTEYSNGDWLISRAGAEEILKEIYSYRTILKDLQFDKVDDKLIHIDLLELVDDKKVVADIPVKFVGVSKGVKDGGKLVSKMKSLKVKTYPKYLKEQIEVPIDDLELNGNIRVEDVKQEHYEILNSPRIQIASVVMTRQLKQEEATATPAAAAKK